MQYRRNHEVARCLLNRWRTGKAEKPIVWAFDIVKQRVLPSTTGRRRGCSFATRDDLYVPQINGQRLTHAEQWFSRSETVFNRLLEQVERGARDGVYYEDLMHFIRAIVSLHYRSAYEISQIEAALMDQAEIRNQLGISVPAPSDAHRRAVENCVNAAEAQMSALLPSPVLEVVTGISYDLLICDRPVLETDQNELWMPLGPRSMIMIRKGRPGDEGFFVNSCPMASDKFIQLANNFTIERARRWVVGTSRGQLEQVMPRLSTPEVDRRRDKDKLRFSPRQSSAWWSLPAAY